jgi:hypothetical protein
MSETPKAEVPDFWSAAFAVIKSHFSRWSYIRRLTASHPDYVAPEEFCDDLLGNAFADRRFLIVNNRRTFFDWACQQPNIKILLPVLAGHDLLRLGDKVSALRHLDLGLVLDQEDLYAQALWFSARGEPIQDIDPKKFFCTNPFERLESSSRNRLMFCCPAWLPTPAGSLEDGSAEDVWNSQAAQDIRASIHDGSYRYCSRMHCPKLVDKTLARVPTIKDPEMKDAWAEKKTVLPTKIKRIALAHDRSCNISCPSCRTKLIIANKAENTRLDALIDNALLPLMLASRRISMTGSGDPFSSNHFRSVLRRLTALPKGPIIDLQTNGLLMARSWNDLGLPGRVGNVLVSIDAAKAETYAVIRRGGDFEDLMENLAFLSALRRENGVDSVRLDFVVQALNYREMPAAAEIMRKFQFDKIKFQMLRSWNTWSAEDFRKNHVGHPGHPEYDDFVQVLQDPRLAGPDVEWSGFYALRPNRSASEARSGPITLVSKTDARQAASLG